MDEVISVANNYVAPTKQTNSAIDTIFCKVDIAGDTVLYQILYKDKSFVLLSGSKACLPILAYGEAGSRYPIWDNTHDVPGGLLDLLGQYEAQVRHCFENDKTTLSFQADWCQLISNTNVDSKSVSSIVVPILLTSEWGQSVSNDSKDSNAYNYYIDQPDGCSHNAPTGCCAVAMAQVLNYWKFPVYNVQGSRQFDWCNMANKLDTSSSNYENERNSVAWLMKECGRLADMDYGCGESVSDEMSICRGLIDLGYTNSSYLYRGDFYVYYNYNWEDILKTNLNAGMPVIYGAKAGNGYGHAFVVDGYSSDNKFHINWGRNGLWDNYYELRNLNPNDSIQFNSGHVAIFGILPSSSYSSFCDFDMDLCNHYDRYYNDLNLDELEPWENVPQTAQNLTSASSDCSSSADWYTIPTGEHSSYIAHESVVLQDGFHAERGSDFVAKILPCPNCDNNDRALSKGGNAAENMGTNVVEKSGMSDIKDTISIVKNEENLFPNPCKEKITYRGNGVDKVFVYDITGKPVYRWFVLSRTDKEISLDIKNIKTGLYLLYVVNKDGSHSVYKFVKE